MTARKEAAAETLAVSSTNFVLGDKGDTVTRSALTRAGVNVDALVAAGHLTPRKPKEGS